VDAEDRLGQTPLELAVRDGRTAVAAPCELSFVSRHILTLENCFINVS
jgi:hypothetical protein